MRNMDILSSSGEAAVSFKTMSLTVPPTVSAVSFSVSAATDLVTVSSTAGYYNGMAFTLNSLVGGTGLSSGRVYWVGNLSGNTFKVYTNPALAGSAAAINVTLDGTGTLSSYTLTPTAFPQEQWTIDYSNQFPYQFFVDGAGKVWWVNNYLTTPGTVSNTITYLGNVPPVVAALGQGICAYAGYLFVFSAAQIDYLKTSLLGAGTDLASGTGWHYNWQTVSGGVKDSLVARNNKMYWCESRALGSLSTNTGSTFDPATSSTYTYTQRALDLPNSDSPQCMSELGQNLLIGGIQDYIYPWNKVDPSFGQPVQLPEKTTYKLITINNLSYAFTGNRGYIYITNGSSSEEFRKIPDTLSGVISPYYAWCNATSSRNKLFFSFTASKNDGTALNNVSGIWSIDLSKAAIQKPLNMANQLSYASYAGSCDFIMPNVMQSQPAGSGLYAGWSLSGVAGFDASSGFPYSNFESYIDTEIVPVGTFIENYTPRHFEFKLSKPLVSGEGIRLSARTNLSDSYILIGSTTTNSLISDAYDTDFQNAEWVQFRIETCSTTITPSYVTLTQIFMDGAA